MSTPFWIETPPVWTPTSEEYYSRTDLVGSSALADFRKSRRLYEGRYITGDIEFIETTDAMLLGSLVDGKLTEPEEVKRKYAVTDASYRSTEKRRNRAWDADERANPGKILVKRELWDKSDRMVESLMRNDNARNIMLGPGLPQATHTWDDNGVPCRLRLDKAFEYGGDPAFADLKAWNEFEPEPVERLIYNRGTHDQMALYERGFIDLWGRSPHIFLVVIHNEEPFEVAVFYLSEDYLDIARVRVEQDLIDLGQCLATGDFSNVSESRIHTLLPPRWAK